MRTDTTTFDLLALAGVTGLRLIFTMVMKANRPANDNDDKSPLGHGDPPSALGSGPPN